MFRPLCPSDVPIVVFVGEGTNEYNLRTAGIICTHNWIPLNKKNVITDMSIEASMIEIGLFIVFFEKAYLA